MTKLRLFFTRSLKREISFSSIVCIVIAILVFYFSFLEFQNLGDKLSQNNVVGRQYASYFRSELQRYIDDNQIDIDSLSDITPWAHENEDHLYFYLHDQSQILYELYGNTEYLPEEEGPDITPGFSYSITLADNTQLYMYMYCYPANNYLHFCMVASIVLGAISFNVIFFLFVRRKLKYIYRMKQELDVLAGGDLNYNVTIYGNDELTTLAEGINQMKSSILQNQYTKEQAERANSELITAMSHDLRSPLTSLIGYLEILKQKKFSSEEQELGFLNSCMGKAVQIKDMSDQLFEYFLVHATDWDGKEKETFPLREYITSILSDFTYNLELESFQVEQSSDSEPNGELSVNSDLLKRVFDNLLSNLKKYADSAYPVTVSCHRNNNQLLITIKNHIQFSGNKKESTQIGLKTCEQIMQYHQGTFQHSEKDNVFTVTLLLPVISRK